MDNTCNDSKSKIFGINFSIKEEAVIHEFVTGASYKIISDRLHISQSTLEYHIRNIMNKTGCNSKAQLMMFLNKKIELSKKQNNAKVKQKKVVFISAIIFIISFFATIIWFFLCNNHSYFGVSAISGKYFGA